MKAKSFESGLQESLLTQASSRSPVGHILLLVGVSVVLFLLNAALLPLADPEESRCGLIVRDMQTSGDWLVPHLEGRPYFDKPAPFFLLAAAAVQLTGSEELGGRLIPALGGILAVLVTYAFASRVFRCNLAGLLAGLILATSGQFLFMARWYRMDMPFVAAMWAAIWWLWRADNNVADNSSDSSRSASSSWRGWVGFYVFTAIATLFKGPAGLGLPLLIMVVYMMLTGKRRRLLGVFHPVGVGLFLLIAAPWYVAVSLWEPSYAYEFFIRQNLLRYTGGGHLGHTWPGILYIPILLAGLLPWTIYLPGAVIRYFPRRWQQFRECPDMVLLWATALVTITFFAISKTKLPSYILPALPPLAILIGGLIAQWIPSHRPDKLLWHGARALLVTILLMPLMILGLEIYLRCLDGWVVLPLAVTALIAWQMRASLTHAKRQIFIGWAMGGIVFMFVFLIGHTAPTAYDRMSTRSLAVLVPSDTEGKRRICFWANKELSFIFYTHADDGTKFTRSDPEDLNDLVDIMRSDYKVYCLVSGEKQMQRLSSECSENLRTLGQVKDRWLVTNVMPTLDGPSTKRATTRQSNEVEETQNAIAEEPR